MTSRNKGLTLLSAVFLTVGLVLTVQGGWIHAKAFLAQYLLNKAFAETIVTGQPVKPWSWADTWPVARIEVPRLHESAIALKYTDRAVMARMEASKDTGTVRFDDGAVTVIADLPKRVDWDQAQLAQLVERISAAGDDPTEYVDVSFKVAERKYAAWPESIRQTFEPARTVRTGALKVKLELNGGAQ